MNATKFSSGGALRVLSGILLLARFKATGFVRLGDTTQAFLTSLTPLLAFPLVGFALTLLSGGAGAFSDLFMTVAAVLAPPVISHALAVAWRREALWARFATAFNWCQWAIPLAALVVFTGFGLAWRVGLPTHLAAILALFVLAGYGLGLHYFLARRGLELPVGRSIFLVLAINLGTAAVILIPRLLTADLAANTG